MTTEQENTIQERKSVDPRMLRLSDDGGSGVVLGTHCNDCDEDHAGELSFCPNCTSENTHGIELPGNGTLWDYSVVHQSVATWQGPLPYVTAHIKLGPSALLLTQVLDWEESDLKVGAPMELHVQPLVVTDEGTELMGYQFRPVK